jgi:hypothetical protein
MTASTIAFYYVKPRPGSMAGSMQPESPPEIIWGQGTPAAIAPFTTVNKGSIFMQTNGTDDESSCWIKVDEGEDADDWVQMLTSGGNVFAPALESGDSVSSISIASTPTGSGATWYSPLFVQANIGNVATGYTCAAEFEMNASNTNSAQWYVLSLNANGTDTSRHNRSSYIALWDYGTTAKRLNSLFNFASLGTIPATASTTALISKLGAGKETTCDAAVRFVVDNTPYWFLCSTTAPA